jgi:hypothetical protein
MLDKLHDDHAKVPHDDHAKMPHDSGGQGGSRTPERSARADLQSAPFSHLDTCPSFDCRLWIADFRL